MGIDPEITGNSASTLGDLEACVRADVDPGDFDDGTADYTIDVYVTGDPQAPAPSSYEASLVYDADRVDPVSWDDLIKLPGGTSYTAEMPSRLNAGAYNLFGAGTAGDGTLVRIDLDVISAGYACFEFGFAKAYASDENHPAIPQAASVAINTDCATDDSDGDGVIDMCDNCRDVPNAGQEDYDGDGWGEECDACPTIPTKWYAPPGDEDCDGFSTTVEQYLGTDPADNCPDWPATPDLCPGPSCDGDDVWPLDNTVDTEIDTTGDVWSYVGHIGATGGSPDTPECPGPLSGDWSQRLDLDHSCDIDVTGDVWMFVGMVGEDCDAP